MVISKVKGSINIKTAVERYTDINLKRYRKGQKQLNVRCPFHEDHNPSLTLYFQTARWYCHAGCGGGDQIDLVQKSLNLTLKQTLYILIKDLGLEKDQDTYNVKEVKQTVCSKAYNRIIISNFDREVGEAFLNLLNIKNRITIWSKQITCLNDINDDFVYQAYHLKPKIEKWLDDLSSNNYEIQYFSLLAAKLHFKEALGTWLKTKK